MPKISFTENDIQYLSQSEGIEKVTSKSITYNKEFKVAVATCKNISEVRDMFDKWNIDSNIVGDSRIEQSWYRWRRQIDSGGGQIFTREQCGRKGKDYVPDKSHAAAYIAYLERELELKDQQLVVIKKYIPTWTEQNQVGIAYVKLSFLLKKMGRILT